MRISDWSSDVCSSDLTYHPVPRQIGDRRLADDRRQMMFAVGLKRDVLQQDDLVVAAHFFEGAAEMDGRIFSVALRIFLPGARDPRRSIKQAFTFRNIAGPANERSPSFPPFPRHPVILWEAYKL